MPIYIFWSGYGFLVPLIYIFWIFTAAGFTYLIFGTTDFTLSMYSRIIFLSCMLYTALSLYFMGKYINSSKQIINIDPVSGEKNYENQKKHTFMFIKIEYWGILMFFWFLIGIWNELNEYYQL